MFQFSGYDTLSPSLIHLTNVALRSLQKSSCGNMLTYLCWWFTLCCCFTNNDLSGFLLHMLVFYQESVSFLSLLLELHPTPYPHPYFVLTFLSCSSPLFYCGAFFIVIFHDCVQWNIWYEEIFQLMTHDHIPPLYPLQPSINNKCPGFSRIVQ